MSILQELLNEYEVSVDVSDPKKAIEQVRKASRMGAKRLSIEDKKIKREQLRKVKASNSPTKALELQLAQKQEQVRNLLDRIAAARKQQKGVTSK
jgi:hypothetical protein